MKRPLAFFRWLVVRGEARIYHLCKTATLAHHRATSTSWGVSPTTEPSPLACLGIATAAEAVKNELSAEQFAQHLEEVLGFFHFFRDSFQSPERIAAWQKQHSDIITPSIMLEDGTQCWEFSTFDDSDFIFVEAAPGAAPRVWLNSEEITNSAETDYQPLLTVLRTLTLPHLNWRQK